MMTLPPDPKALLLHAGLWAKKSWGQHFLRDRRVLNRMAQVIGAAPGVTIVELGAGLGALTYALLEAGANVAAVERDRDLVPILKNALASYEATLTILETDAANLDYRELNRKLHQESLLVAGNLPYQLSGRILVSLAAVESPIRCAVLLVQHEVAERLMASPGTRTYGLLSVLVQRSFIPTRVCHVPPGAFLPPPKVDSAVVLLSARPNVKKEVDDALFVRVAKAAFHSRRKTLKNSLQHGLSLSAEVIMEAIEEADLDPSQRAEMLSLTDFYRLTEHLAPFLSM